MNKLTLRGEAQPLNSIVNMYLDKIQSHLTGQTQSYLISIHREYGTLQHLARHSGGDKLPFNGQNQSHVRQTW